MYTETYVRFEFYIHHSSFNQQWFEEVLRATELLRSQILDRALNMSSPIPPVFLNPLCR